MRKERRSEIFGRAQSRDVVDGVEKWQRIRRQLNVMMD